MHRLFVPPEQLAQGERVRLTPAQARHLETVLRLEPGAPLEAFDGEGRSYEAVLEPGAVHVVRALPVAQRAADVWVAQALARADKLELVVQKATELGATRILPLRAERSVPRLDGQRSEARAARWQRIAQEAARQCGRSDVPRVDAPCSLADVCAALEPGRRGLLLDTEERTLRLAQAARGAARLCLVVGPEGGFAAAERAALVSCGVLPVSLGPLVLRTETAALAALAVVRHVFGELG
jgi:16S rRNA (uracil1498-N3)-methyltransferase